MYWPLGVYLLVGVVSAGLLHSWWTWLVVPAAWSIAAILSIIFQGGGIDLQNMIESGFEGVDFLVFFGVAPIAIGAAIGTPSGTKIEQRLQH